jgi:hypothetical protein
LSVTAFATALALDVELEAAVAGLVRLLFTLVTMLVS